MLVPYLQALYGLYVPANKFKGQGLVEYALILALVSIVAIGALFILGGKAKDIFSKVSNSLEGAPAGS